MSGFNRGLRPQRNLNETYFTPDRELPVKARKHHECVKCLRTFEGYALFCQACLAMAR